MDEPAVSRQRDKPGWDKRTWYLALIISIVMAVLEAPEAENSLHRLIHEPLASNLMSVSLFLSLFVAPPILSGIARRRTLLWAYFPFAVFVGAAFGLNELPQPPDPPDTSSSMTTTDDIAAAVAVFTCPLISAGPVCLYRVLRRRAQARRVATDAALVQAMRTRQEGVWPPAPAQLAQESPAEKGE